MGKLTASTKPDSTRFFKHKNAKKAKSIRHFKNNIHLLANLGIKNMTDNNYISSPIDKPDLFSVRIVHLLKKHAGQGLFAEKEISANTWIGEYTGQVFTHQEFDRYLETTPDADRSYAMMIADKIIDARIKGNFTRYINFSDNHANVEFVSTQLDNQERVILVATRRIAPGEQLLVDYNTYDERASKYFYFLNAQDTWLSTLEFYEAHRNQYEKQTSPEAIDAIELSPGQSYYSTPIGKRVLCNEPLTSIGQVFADEVNLPYIRLMDDVMIDALEADLFTPLMVACLLGQVNNVDWLILHGGEVNQQQNHSGNCPLFFALKGYKEHAYQKMLYVDIIKILIANQAKVTVHDRQDRTFIHKACSILNTDDFEEVMHWLSQTLGTSYKELFTYLNQDNEDILIHCLNTRDFAKVSVLLVTYPQYFEENFYQGESQEMNQEAFRKAINSFSEDEKNEVVKILTCNCIEVTLEFLAEFNLMTSTHQYRR